MGVLLSIAAATALLGGKEIVPIRIGAAAPEFELTTLAGRTTTSADLIGDAREKRVVVLVFWSYRCPWAVAWTPTLAALARQFASEPRVRFVVVDSDRHESGDPDAVRAWLAAKKCELPVYLDPLNRVADALGAIATPHCFVIGAERRMVYTGRIDDSCPLDPPAGAREPKTSRRAPVRQLLHDAIVAALAAKRPAVEVDAPAGCRIKRQ
jgi:hypothetical protein